MKRSELTKLPVALFAVPPAAPKPVAAAHLRFERVAAEWQQTRHDDIAAAERAAEVAMADAVRSRVDSAKSGDGKEVPDLDQVERESAAKIAVLRAKSEVLAVAVDESGNELATEIAEHRHEWLAQLASERLTASATERLAADA
ncbi:MAG: hypothetical protein ACJ76I_07055 [Gaiellaceae bacterium]